MEISVIITNYNYGHCVARAIRSVLNQSFNSSEYEIVVIDDCSTDNSRNVISGFGVLSIYNDTNLGLAASCNKAFKVARGKFTIRLDADDYVAKDWLLILHSFISNNKDEMDCVSSDYLEVSEKEVALARRNGMTWPIACGILYKTDDILALGGYKEDIPREDIDFRERFLKSGRRIYNVPVPLYRYTNTQNSLSKRV